MNKINFLPESFRRQAELRHRKYRYAVLLSVFALCLAGWGMVERSRNIGPRQYAESLEQQVQAARDQMTELKRLQQEQKLLIRQQELQHDLGQPVSTTQMIAVLSHILPPSVTLTDLKMSTHRPDPEPLGASSKKKHSSKSKKSSPTLKPVDDYVDIDLQAVAPDDLTVANVIGDLADHRLFDQVAMKYSRPTKWQDIDARQFRLTMRVRLDRKFELEVAHAD